MLTDSNVRSASVLENSTTRLSLTNSLTGFTQAVQAGRELSAASQSAGRTAGSQAQSFCGRRPKVAGLRP
ncbi:hypothetical protein EOA22_25045 [Mesorhizobium sp. M7A.F.Ca.US.014.04.1.1]|nr:hypothetical protein EOC84_04280 [Mesorhizobium sp. Primo-B]RUU37754.1 hypothetical protein EOC83_15935 [Mesorhizobium sp. Primo-A]RUX17196.1 hypothetical protein EN996_06015 [Mesorhizobium sp. M7A.F.Ca.CA.002.14.1.2]RUX37398.1 hypothetical protein EN987_20490 [Mesorhizobium sp. M7A.F.Ca.CA.002.11.2.1]RUX56579.1 hypothetical protein EN989_22795 [Mesorhizobium sp. M7A.F.Ca.CA.002.12.1.1]RUX57102.1 hypothetical protein EOA22_25045 [Mesorhizobium sp. M7A.F.Ca.US.014.04.1.1]RUY44808.1 hypothet